MRRDMFVDRSMATRTVTGQGAGDLRLVAFLVIVAMVLLAMVYGRTVVSMVAIWSSSETFAHGFVVPVISVWLAWRQRASLARAVPRPALITLVPVAIAGFAWLLGELAEVNALRQFAFVAMLGLAVPTIAGLDVARRLTFPLAFLLFAVPFGEFMLPQLMEWTAMFTVAALRASGIPVYQEGLSFVIPSGRWSVVEACSGVRYLIASLMVGTLFAYLTFHSRARQVAFVGIAIAVPLVANWLRAYLIVMLGHVSGNQIAVGVDHLIYGWLFFGIVMALMFWIGARMRDDIGPAVPERVPASANRTEVQRHAGGAVFGVATTLFLAVAVAPIVASRVMESAPSAAPQYPGLAPLAGWSEVSPPAWRPRFLAPSTERQEAFVRDGQPVSVYVAYYRNQSGDSKLISSENVMVPSSDKEWKILGSGVRTQAGGGLSEIQVVDIGGPAGQRLRVWYWFWVDGKWTASPTRAKALTAVARLAGRADDSAVVVLSTPQGSEPAAVREADAILGAFVQSAVEPLSAALQATRAQR